MALYSDYVRDDYGADGFGRPIAGATATLFTQDGNTQLQQTTTDQNGFFSFTATDGQYLLVTEYGDAIDRRPIIIGLPQSLVDSAAAGSAMASASAAKASATTAVANASTASIAAASANTSATTAIAFAQALMAGRTYSTTASGIAGTTDGQFFVVSNGMGTLTLWKNSAGTAVSQNYTLASNNVYDALAAEQQLLPRQDFFRADRAQVGKYYYPFSGALADDPAEFATHKIPIISGQTNIWTSTHIGSGIGRISFFDASDAFIGSNDTIGSLTGGFNPYVPIPIPANARTFGISGPVEANGPTYANRVNPDLKIFAFDPGGPQERGYGRLPDRASLSPVAGKRLAILGDSRFDPQGSGLYNPWLRICRSLDAHIGIPNATYPQFPDTAKSGRQLADALTRYDGTPLVAADFANVSVVCVELGANDAATTAIGNPTDTETANTIYGHLFRIFKQLATWNPYMRVFLATPYLRADVPIANQLALAAAYRNFGLLNQVQVYDHFVESGINAWNIGTMAGDGIHAGDDGLGGGGMNYAVVNGYASFIRNRLTPPTTLPYESKDVLTI